MAETINIGEISQKLSEDIFEHFFWKWHPKRDENFACHNSEHVGTGGKPKLTHPGDVVFSYDDPYLGNTIYLHTDLKSYSKDAITQTKLRDAFKSFAMATDCARNSDIWRSIFSVDTSSSYEVRGLLFIHNHDHGYQKKFSDVIDIINFESMPIAANVYMHYLGPDDIQRLYSIGNDIIRQRMAKLISDDYTFYYPDLVMSHRIGDVWVQPATIEALTSPYLIIRHRQTHKTKAGYVIYYNRQGDTVEEFTYLLDTLSRYQILDADNSIRVRTTTLSPNKLMKSNFELAKKRYAQAWGFDPIRESILDEISIDTITTVTDTYNPGDMGWRE